jgi:hypothetical protein
MSSSLFSESINLLALNGKIHAGTLEKSSSPVNHFADRQPPRPVDCAFPDQADAPACSAECCLIPQIAAHISAYLFPPEFFPGLGPSKLRAIMPVPEAAVYKQNRTELRKHQIRPSRQLPVVQPISETSSVQQLSDQQLGLCVGAPDRRHIPAAGFGIVNVSQPSGPERRSPVASRSRYAAA